MTDIPLQHGSCQCGAVAFSARTALDALARCNCSRCRRMGWVLQPVPQAQMQIERGLDTLSSFRFNSHSIDHLFCPVCGVQPFARGTGPGGEALYMVNVNCLDDAQYDPASVTEWNGAAF